MGILGELILNINCLKFEIIGEIVQKRSFYYHLLTRMCFQTCVKSIGSNTVLL